jgi:signal transduction histidine kinase/CheY-like chemotaxis protein
MRAFLHAQSVSSDYGWFVAAVIWAVVGWLWWRGRSVARPALVWVPWAVAGGLAVALLEIAFNSLSYVEYFEPRLLRSLQLGLAGGLVAVGFALALGGPRRRWLPASAAALVILLCGGLRWQQNPAAGLIECLLILGLALRWCLGPEAQPTGLRWPAVAAALTGWLGTAGPLALWTQEEARWVDSSLWAWPSAGAQIVAAGSLAVVFTREIFEDGVRRRLVRLTTLALALWLTVGFVVAWAASRSAQRNFRLAAEARAQTAALLLDGDALAKITGPALRFTERTKDTTPEGWTSELWFSPRLAAKDTDPTRAQLKNIAQANPDVRFVDFSIVRDGGLLAVLFPEGSPGQRTEAAWQRPLTVAHADSWLTGRPLFEGPFRNPWGTMVHALAPVRTKAGRTVGWVVLQWGSGEWAGSQLNARLLAFAVLGAGVIIGLLWFGRHLSSLDRSSALQRVAVATAEMAAQSAFLAKISHELRTPLQGILGNAKLLEETTDDPASSRRLRLLRGEAEHLHRLVEDLLDLSALEAGGFRQVEQAHDFRRLVADTVESFETRATQRGLTLRQSFAGDGSGWVRIDVMRIRQVLINLLSNALKFTQQGGVTVHLELRHAGGLVQAAVSVTDTGPGIAPDDIAKLFQPFARLPGTQAVEGVGLGLALSAALCRQMGGSLTAESDGRSGSTFRLLLPLRPAQPDRTEPAVVTTSPETPLAGCVLIVDDHPAVQELYQDWLTTAGATCLSATSAAAARQLLRQHAVHAVVLDLSLGSSDGCELAAEWRRQESGLPRRTRIIGVSAHAAPADRERALQAGMDAFLLKPVARPDLLAALRLAADDNPARLPAPLRHRFNTQLDADWRRLRTDIEEAIRAADWGRVATDAHYLKNSADVLSLGALQRSCARLETAAGDGHARLIAEAFAEMTDDFARLEAGRTQPTTHN